MSSNLYTFYAPFVYVDSVENHSKIKKEYYPKILECNKEIKSFPDTWACKCNTSFGHRNINSNLFMNDNFVEIIWNSLDRMLTDVDPRFFPADSLIESIWFNYYEKGNFQEAHNHQGPPSIIKGKTLYYTSFSGIYIFHSDNQEVGPTFYASNLDSNSFASEVKHTPKAEEGSIIWFPSNLTHFVSPALKERISISFNILSNYRHT